MPDHKINNNSRKEVEKARKVLQEVKIQEKEKINKTHKWVKTFKGYALVKIKK